MLVWEGGGRREAPVRLGRPPVCWRVRRQRGPPPLTAAPAPSETLHRLRQMEMKTKRSASGDCAVPRRRFQRVSLRPTGGRGGALYFFWSMAGPSRGDRGRRKAVPEKAGPASGVPPHRRSEDVARQATCRPVSGTKRSQEHSEASVSRVYRR